VPDFDAWKSSTVLDDFEIAFVEIGDELMTVIGHRNDEMDKAGGGDQRRWRLAEALRILRRSTLRRGRRW